MHLFIIFFFSPVEKKKKYNTMQKQGNNEAKYRGIEGEVMEGKELKKCNSGGWGGR